MPVYKKKDLPKLLDQAAAAPAALYIVTGERSLCLETVKALAARIIPDPQERGQAVRKIDGERENPAEILGILRSASLFSSRTLVVVDDTGLFRSKKTAERAWDRAEAALADGDEDRARTALLAMLAAAGVEPDELAGLDGNRWNEAFGFPRPEDGMADRAAGLVAGARLPERKGDDVDRLAAWAANADGRGNVLILVARDLDRRTAAYKKIGKHAAVVDLKVDTGPGKAAREGRAALMQEALDKALAAAGKRMAPAARRLLLDRVGFHPEAVRTEVEKLALHDPAAGEIGLEAVRELVPVTGEHAIFELTEAFFARRFPETVALLDRLLEGGMFPLAVIAGIRNQARKLLVAAEAARDPELGFSAAMSFPAFQKSCLPRLKEKSPDTAKGHPYAAYMLMLRAAKLDPGWIVAVLAELLECERMMKGSGVADRTLLFAAALTMIHRRP